ncbi:MAG: 50S ribosomal protein L10 [Christensenellaceae bacterium]
MSANKEAKQAVVAEIRERIEKSGSVVFVQYDRLTVAEVSALRAQFKKAGCEYKVYKNTLVRKAFHELGVEAFDADLNGTTATIFSADETSAAKILRDAIKADKALEEKVVTKSAYVDKAYVDKKGVAALASIPSKEQLIAKMLGSLQAPISALARVLGAVAEKKQEG